MTKEPRKLTRIMLSLSIAAGISREQLKQGLTHHRTALEQRFGKDAEMMISIQQENDPFTMITGARKIESAAAIMQISYPDNWPEADIANRLKGLANSLAEVIDTSTSALVFGRAYLLLEVQGNAFCGFIGRRDPGKTVDEMRNWWLHHHAPYAQSLTGYANHGYDQLHVDREASQRLCAASGFPYTPYDMADCLDLPNQAEFLSATADPEIARKLYEDEVGFLDHSSWRGAFTDKI